MPIPKPALLQGKQPLQDLQEFYQDRTWVGLDLYHAAQDLGLGFVTQADNLYNVGGGLMIRPGKQGQLAQSSLLPGAAYMIGSMLDASGETWLLFVSGATSTTGKLWKISASAGGTSATEIELNTGTAGSPVLQSMALNSATVQGARFGSFFYLIDGSSDGKLYRTDLTYAYATSGLEEPTVAPVASAISASALPGFDPDSATYDAPPQTSLFMNSWAAIPGNSGWTSHNGWPNNFPCFGPGAIAAMPGGNNWNFAFGVTSMPVQWAVFGGSGTGSPDFRGASMSTPIVNNVEHTDGTGDQAKLFLLTFYYFQESTGAIQVTMKGFTGLSGSGSTYTQIYNVQPQKTAAGAALYPTCTLLFDFSAMPAIKSWQAEFTDIGRQGSGALFIGNILGYPLWGAFAQTAGNIVLGDFNTGAYVANSVGYNTDSQGSDVQLQGQTVSSLTKDARLTVGFGSGAVASVALTPTTVASVTIPLGGVGTGYTSAPTVSFSGGGGTGAAGTATISSGKVTGVTITNPGSGYTSEPTVSFSGGGGTGATGTVVLTGTSIASVTITTHGAGYLLGTVVEFQDTGGGTGAVGHVNLNGTNPFPAGNGILSVDIVEGGSAYTGATQAVFGQSFASLEFVSVPLRGFIQGGTLQFESPANAIALRLLPAGNDSTGNPWTYQNVPLTIDTAGGFASGDLTALLPSAVACVSKAQILFLDNPVVSAAAFNCNVGALTIAGNLSVGFASYTYAYTEVNSNGDTQLVEIIESDPSPFSNTVSPTGEFATAQVALPDHSILNNGVSDMWYLYRAGGTFSDGLFRLVDAGHWTEAWTFGQSRSGDTPPGMQLTPQNGFTTWGQNDQKNNAAPAGSKYFVDNTPDANLVNNPTLVVGKQAAPPGAQAIASFQNRLWLAVGGTVISSWLLDASSDAGLYFNPTLDPSDPNAPIKGSGTIPVGMDDGDPVVGLKTLGTVLTVWKGLSSYFIDGYDPTNFGCNEYTAIEGQGLVAPKGIVVADNVIYLLQQDGVYTFDGSQLAKISDAIGPYIRPVLNEDGGHISASAYANTSCVFHGGRLYLFAPVTGGTQNSVAHLWDGRFQAWVGRWTGTNITSAVSIGSNTDDPDLWAGGYDGQLYRFIGNGDTPAAGGLAAVAVTNAGSGYGSAPTISFSGGGGSGAAGTATVSGGKVTGVTITNPGGGYTSAPTVSFSGGGGSGAAAAAGLFAPVPFTLATRAYGRPPEGLSIWLQGRYNLPLGIEEGGWEPFFRKVRVTRLWLEAVNGGLGALGLTAGVQYTDQVSAVTYPVSVTGHQRVSVRAKPGRGGLGVIVTLAGATASGLSIVAAGATISRGARME